MMEPALYDFSPVLRLVLMILLLAAIPLTWLWLRSKNKRPADRLRALTVFTLFLTFDLIGFGAFTRLTDSGLGCPDWPGCYGSASPIGAKEEIADAQAEQPHGPVTHKKAWIEMIHRYLAAIVGMLILFMAAATGVLSQKNRLPVSPNWAYLTLLAVCLQGAFGAFTVTLKLYPAIVTAHLLGGVALLMLLVVQAEAYGGRTLDLSRRLVAGILLVGALVIIQITLGAWVSTNYAVLACTEFPTCQGQWWPPMDFQNGFTVLRPLGRTADGGFLSLPALTAIHMVHRLFAGVVLAAILALAVALWRRRRVIGSVWASAILALGLWQLVSGLSNVVLGWPIVSALAHTMGAAALMGVLTMLCCRAFRGFRSERASSYNLTSHG